MKWIMEKVFGYSAYRKAGFTKGDFLKDIGETVAMILSIIIFFLVTCLVVVIYGALESRAEAACRVRQWLGS